MGSKSKSKGNRGENLVVKLLSEWWGSNEFHRNLESGAIGTIMEARGNYPKHILDSLKGDILCPIDFPFYCESKNYAEIDLYSILRNPGKNLIDTWWTECIKQTKYRTLGNIGKDCKIPIIFIHEDRKEYFVVMPREYASTHMNCLRNDEKDYAIAAWTEFKRFWPKETVLMVEDQKKQGHDRT